MSMSALVSADVMNLSSNNLASYEAANIACTIVSGYEELLITAESPTQDTFVGAFFPHDPTVIIAFNDDWIDLPNYAYAYDDMLRIMGRIPNRATDAAIKIWARNTPVCGIAMSHQKNGYESYVNLSITRDTAVATPYTSREAEDGFGIIESDDVSPELEDAMMDVLLDQAD